MKIVDFNGNQTALPEAVKFIPAGGGAGGHFDEAEYKGWSIINFEHDPDDAGSLCRFDEAGLYIGPFMLGEPDAGALIGRDGRDACERDCQPFADLAEAIAFIDAQAA